MPAADLLAEFGTTTGSYQVAVLVVTLSILIAGICLGVGVALRNRRIQGFGREELVQAIINAALIGVLFTATQTLNAGMATYVPTDGVACTIPAGIGIEPDTVLGWTYCQFGFAQQEIESVLASFLHSTYNLGYVSKIGLDFDVVSGQPFFGLEAVISTWQGISQTLGWLSVSAGAHLFLIALIAGTAFTFFLPAGLILRSFFATRKLGGMIMAAAIGFYLVYPLLFVVVYQGSQFPPALDAAAEKITAFNDIFSPGPLVNLEDTGAVKTKLDELAAGDLVGKVAGLTSAMNTLVSFLVLQLVLIPLFVLGVTAVAIYELAGLLGGEVTVGKFELI